MNFRKMIPGIVILGFLILAIGNPVEARRRNKRVEKKMMIHQMPSKILMVVTGVGEIPGTGRPTGFWGEEFVVPFRIFHQAGFQVVVASPRGKVPPVDPGSVDPKRVGEKMAKKVKAGLERAVGALRTMPLGKIRAQDYAAVFVVGGHGVMWDLTNSKEMHALAVQTLANLRVLSAVCHGPGAIARAKLPNGSYLLSGRKVTGFSSKEEEAAGMTEIVPYCLEDLLRKNSNDNYSSGEPFKSHVVSDENVITGQNPVSSEATARAVLARIDEIRYGKSKNLSQ